MEITQKTRFAVVLWLCFLCMSCSGPEEKQPEKISKENLPQKADSLSNKPKDGVMVPVDSISQPEINANQKDILQKI